MRVVDYKDGILTVEMDNHSGYEITHIIPDLTVNTEAYDLTSFGEKER